MGEREWGRESERDMNNYMHLSIVQIWAHRDGKIV